MSNLITLAAVGVGGLALYRAYDAHAHGVPLKFAFDNPFRSIAELKAMMAAGPPSPTGAATIAAAVYQSIPKSVIDAGPVIFQQKTPSAILLDYKRS